MGQAHLAETRFGREGAAISFLAIIHAASVKINWRCLPVGPQDIEVLFHQVTPCPGHPSQPAMSPPRDHEPRRTIAACVCRVCSDDSVGV